MDAQKLINILKGHKVYLQTHDFPDPDALASAYGMQVYLANFGIDTEIVYKGEVEKISTRRMFEEFGITAKNIKDVQNMAADDYIVYVDVQKLNSNVTDFIGNEIACIDHHPTVGEGAEYLYKDVRICGACASIVADYFMESNLPIDKQLATILLYGMKMDTDSFNRGVTEFDVRMYLNLIGPADNAKIVSLYNNSMELSDLYAYGEAIKNIKVYDNIGFANIEFECPDSLIAMVSDFILQLDVVEFAVVYASRKGGYKFSIRNENGAMDAGELIACALEGVGNGGGHASMAGGIIPAEHMNLLGDDIHQAIRTRFLDAVGKR